MTTIEIIDETIEYYRTHPRGISQDRGNCAYLSKEGNMCAVGRCMTEEALMEYGHINGDVYELIKSIYSNLEISTILQPRYGGHSITFWRDLQRLHDNNQNWKKSEDGFNELTEKGLFAVNHLKQTYTNSGLVSA